MPEAPSMAAWWVFHISANEPFAKPSMLSRPLMTVISHGALVRSSGRACRRAVCTHSWRQSPGAGSAISRTWNSRSNAPSCTQYGWAMSSGTRTRRWRKLAARPRRPAIVSRMVAKETSPPGADAGS